MKKTNRIRQRHSGSYGDSTKANTPGKNWRDFCWYHCIDLGDGVMAEGDYDMQRYLPAYRFPEDLRGKRVLDVGRASGFFSFEFERRGADVTATELDSFFDWDFVGGEPERQRGTLGARRTVTTIGRRLGYPF